MNFQVVLYAINPRSPNTGGCFPNFKVFFKFIYVLFLFIVGSFLYVMRSKNFRIFGFFLSFSEFSPFLDFLNFKVFGVNLFYGLV